MTCSFKEILDGKVIEVTVTGKLTKEAYEQFVPLTEAAIQRHGKVRVLFVMHDFHGWDAGALWEDIKFDMKHFSHIERLAIVGETKWEKGMAIFCKPFTTAKLKYFDHTELNDAVEWIKA
jgi:hypothetical protein